MLSSTLKLLTMLESPLRELRVPISSDVPLGTQKAKIAESIPRATISPQSVTVTESITDRIYDVRDSAQITLQPEKAAASLLRVDLPFVYGAVHKPEPSPICNSPYTEPYTEKSAESRSVGEAPRTAPYTAAHSLLAALRPCTAPCTGSREKAAEIFGGSSPGMVKKLQHPH
jgi:hypothetical protein